MNRPLDPVTRMLSDLEPESPPPALRGRALARAQQAWDSSAVPDRWRQIWESRPLRLAWATAVVALLAANLVVPSAPGGQPAVAVRSDPSLTSRELLDVVSLPRLRSTYVGLDVAVADPLVVTPDTPASRARSGKETPS